MKEEGRIPFAYVFAIIFVLMLLLSGIYMAILNGHNDITVSKFYEESDTNLRHVDNMLEEKAYHTIMEVIHNVTKKRDPRIYEIQNYVFQNFSRFINDTFPLETQDYNVTIGNYSIKVVMDYKKVKEFIKNFKLSWIGFTNSIDNSVDGDMSHTMLPVYPYVVGFVNYTYHDKRTNYDMHRHLRFNKVIYSPLPLLKFAFDEFNTSTTNLGDFGRLIRYILTTLAEYRILQGYASGAYDGIEVPITAVLTKQDVEKAVNLALILESVRYFRAYDKNMASSMGIEDIIKRYAMDGTIDASDVLFLWNKMDQNFSVGKVLGQSIYGYADRFVYELLMLFWGNPKNDYFADPTLKEPITNWTEIMNKDPQWRKHMLYLWLDKWRHWMNIPETLNPYMDSAEIVINFDVWILIPNNPAYWIVVPATADMEWTVWTDGVSDTIDLILDNPRDEYYVLNTYSESLDPQYPYTNSKTYTYDVVKKSLVEKHESYSSSGDKYYSTLKFIMDALTRSMKRRSSTYDDLENKGMLDYAAYDVSQDVGNKQRKIYGNPKDYNTILLNGTKDLIYTSSYKDGLDRFNQMVNEDKEKWWRDGAYKQYKDNDDHDAYLYYLCKDTVDLWYEAMKNLYDGGDPDHNDDAGPYDSDCESYPPDFQQSTWPYGYSGWPFYGSMYNGSFNFHRDLNRDAYNNIKALMWVITWVLVSQYGGIDGYPDYDPGTVWDEVKQQTEDARQNVVGDNGLITDLNVYFPYIYYNPISSEMKAFGDLRTFLDYITDIGNYSDHFYYFVRWHVGFRLIGYKGLGGGSGGGSGGGGGNNSGNNTNLTTYAKGVDVSHWQGNIDWSQVYGAGYKFAFVKASQGTSYVDPNFVQNAQNAQAAGLLVGAYHYANPTQNSPQDEADHFADTIRPYMSYLSLPPALDLEEGSSMGWSALSSWAKSFLERVESDLGVKPIIYVNSNYANNLDSSLTQWNLWIAHWTYDPNATPNTGVWSTWMFWQYSDKGSVPGISGDVDLDLYNGKKAMFAARAVGDDILDNMTVWLPESFHVLYKNVVMNANYTSIPLFLSMNQSKRIFWETSYKWDNYTERLKNETMVVDFIPDYLQDGQNINITIETPTLGHKFTDVQDVEEYNDGNSYNLSKAPFAYQFRVKINGEFDMNLRTNRTSLAYNGRHWYTWYNDSVYLNLNLKIPVYTAWFLESHWNDCTSQDNWAFHTDVPFNYTRGYFKMDTNPSESKDSPFFISKPLNMFIDDYENLGEIWNRYSTYYHYAMANMRDEMASWNFTYKNIISNATNVTNNAMKNSDNQFATVGNELNEIFTVQNYLNKLSFFYFERNFNITANNVDENNGYQKYSTDVGGKAVSETYNEGKTRFYTNLTQGEIKVKMKEIYDGITISSTIHKNTLSLQWLSFHQVTGRRLKMSAEATHDVWDMDFGLVGDGDVGSLSKYLPKEIINSQSNNITQELLIKGLHHMLKDIYINETINYRLGVFIRIYAGPESYIYITWFNSTPTNDTFLIWLNNEMRSIVYKVGISEFPQHGYDEIRLNTVYYHINNLWMNLSYESSSIFGFKMRGDFRGYQEEYEINMHYFIDVPTPNSGHGTATT